MLHAKFTFDSIENTTKEIIMPLKDLFGKILKKSAPADIAPREKSDITPFASEAFPVVRLQNGQLESYKKIPLASFSALGTAFAQIPEGARTITQSITKRVGTSETLFVGINPKGIQGFLRENAYGTVGNIMQVNSQGKEIIAGRMRFKAIDNLPITETSTTTLPIDPMLMVVAVALMTLEKKLDGIQQSIETVLQFLKQEKQSRQRGNLNMLAEIMEDYKLNCQNEQFCISRISEVLSIKTAAYQDIDFYQNQIANELQKRKGLHGSKDAQNVLDAVTYQFAEYQLACHLYAFSSFLDVILQKAFDTSAIEGVTEKIKVMAKRYESLYTDCYAQVSKYHHSAIEAKIIDVVGIATTGLGKAIGSIPVIKDGTVDDALISAGESIGKHNEDTINRKLNAFSTLEDNRVDPFVENLQSINLLYSTENAMITDGENLYILQSIQ